MQEWLNRANLAVIISREWGMPIIAKAKDSGVIQPSELEMLGRVFEATSVAGESETEREQRASRILGYFLAGITDEDELRALAAQPLGR
jgi:hypothetical protein